MGNKWEGKDQTCIDNSSAISHSNHSGLKDGHPVQQVCALPDAFCEAFCILQSCTNIFSREALLVTLGNLGRVNTWSALFSVDHPPSCLQSPGAVHVAGLASCHLWLPAYSWSLHSTHSDASQNLVLIWALQLAFVFSCFGWRSAYCLKGAKSISVCSFSRGRM